MKTHTRNRPLAILAGCTLALGFAGFANAQSTYDLTGVDYSGVGSAGGTIDLTYTLISGVDPGLGASFTGTINVTGMSNGYDWGVSSDGLVIDNPTVGTGTASWAFAYPVPEAWDVCELDLNLDDGEYGFVDFTTSTIQTADFNGSLFSSIIDWEGTETVDGTASPDGTPLAESGHLAWGPGSITYCAQDIDGGNVPEPSGALLLGLAASVLVIRRQSRA